jgi:type II secretory pathway component PulJ
MERIPRLPRHAARVVWSSVLALVAVLLVGALWLLQDMHTSTREESEQRLTRFVQGAQNALNRSMSAIDMLLTGVDDMLRLNEAPLSEQDPAYLQQVLQLAAKQNALISSIVVVKSDGKVLAAADNLGNYRVVRIPQNWLQTVAQTPERERMLHISMPDESWAQVRTLHIARYLNSSQGGEHYLVVAQVPVSSWVGLLMQGTALKNLEVTLERADGTLVLRVPLESSARLQADAPPGPLSAPGRAAGRLAPGRRSEPAGSRAAQLRPAAADGGLADVDRARPVVWHARCGAGRGGGVFLLLLAGAGMMQVYMRHMQRAQQRVMESEATLHRAMDCIAAGFCSWTMRCRSCTGTSGMRKCFPGS